MEVTFWGVRGSIPTPGVSTVRYGGNTSCIEVNTGEELIIIDAGTGIRGLGNSLLGRYAGKSIKAHIFLSHTHWDHMHGFPFFVPAFIPGNHFTFYGPVSFDRSLEEIVSGQMKYEYFPVKLGDMNAGLDFVELKETIFNIGNIKIQSKYLNHPILVLGYKITLNGKTVVTLYDTEPYYNMFKEGEESLDFDDLFDEEEEDNDEIEAASQSNEEGEAQKVVNEMNQKVVDFAKGADLAIIDAQYTKDEYATKIGWGHGTFDDAIDIANKAGVKKLAFFHHDPLRKDDELDEIIKNCQKRINDEKIDVDAFAAKEGLTVKL